MSENYEKKEIQLQNSLYKKIIELCGKNNELDYALTMVYEIESKRKLNKTYNKNELVTLKLQIEKLKETQSKKNVGVKKIDFLFSLLNEAKNILNTMEYSLYDDFKSRKKLKIL